MKLNTILIACCLSLGLTQADALEVKPVDNQGTVTAQISSKDMTKIFVEDDRITDIYLSQANIQAEIDKQSGELYMEPTAALDKHPFSVFIKTESGKSYNIFAVPVDRPADTVMLSPKMPRESKARAWETSSHYENLLTTLISSMANGSNPDGYKMIGVITPPEEYLKLGSIAYLKLITVYQGYHVRGEVFEIINRTKKPLHLTEREFYQSGDRAIALESLTLKPHEKTRLYKVVSDD